MLGVAWKNEQMFHVSVIVLYLQHDQQQCNVSVAFILLLGIFS